jgi:hypothetical protein
MNWTGFRGKRSWPNCKVLSRHSPGGTEENHKESLSRSRSPGQRIVPGTSRIWSRSANHSTTTFGEKLVKGL